MKYAKITLLFIFMSLIVKAQSGDAAFTHPLKSAEGLKLINVQVSSATLSGKPGLRVEKSDEAEPNVECLVLLEGVSFHNGVIELELSGEPADGAPAIARGFVGVAFRIDPENIHSYECIYLRPENGRAEDQLQRNHSVQYVSHPDFPWYRQRKERPGVYESYVDLVSGEWTKLKIVVDGETAKLFVHDSEQPVLIVNDLKHGDSEGMVGLWLHTSTLAHFRDLKIIFSN